MVGEKVHYVKKKIGGSRRVPDKIQTVDHNLAGRDDQNKKMPKGWLVRNRRLKVLVYNYRMSKK